MLQIPAHPSLPAQKALLGRNCYRRSCNYDAIANRYGVRCHIFLEDVSATSRRPRCSTGTRQDGAYDIARHNAVPTDEACVKHKQLQGNLSRKGFVPIRGSMRYMTWPLVVVFCSSFSWRPH